VAGFVVLGLFGVLAIGVIIVVIYLWTVHQRVADFNTAFRTRIEGAVLGRGPQEVGEYLTSLGIPEYGHSTCPTGCRGRDPLPITQIHARLDTGKLSPAPDRPWCAEFVQIDVDFDERARASRVTLYGACLF
jgi:hypothetical protein